MRWFFVFFFVSGFCSVLYELVWLRLAMAQFGVTSALVSIVLSMFMAGLGLGSWLSGYLIRRHGAQIKFPALRLYALIELLIGVSAILVPYELLWGRNLLERVTLSSSGTYYLASGVWVALTLVPWCACMGGTIPVAMLAIRNSFRQESQRSFSFLYLANVLGAVAGATLPLLLIELNGFHGTLRVGAILNGVLAASAMALTFSQPAEAGTASSAAASVATPTAGPVGSRTLLALLFTTGLTSMGMEVVWIRQFTPYVGTVVYAFASILALYLLATFAGSRVYRVWSRTHQQEEKLVWMVLGLCALFPLMTADPHLHMARSWRLVIGIAPFSGILGFVTPMLVDRWSGGDPDHAGRAYAVNVLGCIVGPLLSGFLLLPLLSERWVLVLLALPWLLLGLYPGWSSGLEETQPRAKAPRRSRAQARAVWQRLIPYAVVVAAVVLVFTSQGYEDLFNPHVVMRDNTATIIATGQNMQKRLLVNGVGITFLTPITKMMAHMPLAFLRHPPQNALVVCFGMGTTYRSLLSWKIPTTAVELVPSVPKMFWYYHADAPELLKSPLSHVVIDDGRRYLERTSQQYDVITIDPPPPVEAAGSSMLYSKEFYAVIKPRLRPDGILQQWLPFGDSVVQASVARALKESFPYVRVFHSLGGWGFHFIASSQPLPNWTTAELVLHMPASAVADMMEWGPESTPERQYSNVMSRELTLDEMIAEEPHAPALVDDRPVNEYYAIRRRWLKPERWYLLW